LPTHVFSQKAKDAFTTKTHAAFEKAAFSGRLLRATLSEDDLPPAFRFRRKMGIAGLPQRFGIGSLGSGSLALIGRTPVRALATAAALAAGVLLAGCNGEQLAKLEGQSSDS
jgi:hypothetical protein